MEIRNFGIPGANSRQILDRAFADVEAFRPTLAIVLAGTNDCGNKDALLPPQAFRANFREMLSRLNAVGARTIALTLPPLIDRAFKASFGEEPFQGIMPNERAKVANQIVREEAAAFGAVVVDVYAAFAATDLEAVSGYIRHRRNFTCDDGCHPTYHGYLRMAGMLLDRIRELGLDTARIACVGDSITYGSYMYGEGKAQIDGENYPGFLNRLLNPVETPAKPVTDFVQKSVIYQVSMRAFSKEGTFAAVTARMDEIAATGADILYLLPFAESDPDMDRAHWSARQKASGCDNPRNPYRISDYYRVDPEYGTDHDLRALVAAAHAHGMKAMADLVYFHAGPTFAKRHPTFVQRKADGTPADGQWAFPKLDFANPELREHLWGNMEQLVRDFDFDGFRCDVGSAVPLDFWEEGRRRIEKIKPDVILLDEGMRGEDQAAVFDMNYCFPNGHVESILRGDAPAEDFARVLDVIEAGACKGARFLRNYDNHDIANDRYEERLERICGPRAADMLLVLCHTLGGIPFLYCGCEFNDAARHSIFANKGQYVIDRGGDHAPRQALLRDLARLHKSEPALWRGSRAWVRTDRPEQILSYVREADGRRLYVALNFSTHPVRFAPRGLDLAGAGEPLLAARASREGGEVEIGGYGYLALPL